MKPVLTILGVGMVILGIVGVGSAPWLGWLDMAIGILALVAAGALARPDASPQLSLAAPAVLGALSVALFIVALALNVSSWLAWWTLAFGIAFFITTSARVPGGPSAGPPPPPIP